MSITARMENILKYTAINFLSNHMFLKIILIFLCAFYTNIAFAKEQLILAVDLVRHGDRTPSHEIPKSPYHWKEGMGELTQIGKQQELRLGAELRKKYVNFYHLLPENYSPNTMYAHSTDFHRTIESAKFLLLGLYPVETRIVEPSIEIIVVPKSDDKLLIAKPSRNVFSIIKMYLMTRNAWKEKTMFLQDKIALWSKETGILISNFQNLSYIADNLFVRQLHHISLPKGLTESDASEIISLGEWAIVKAFKQPEISYPMGHEFLITVKKYFDKAAEKKSPLKFVLLSGHDASIMSVMNTLGVPLNGLPGYASDLNFLLFEDNKKYYVKISLNNMPVIISKCNSSNLCSLDQFTELAN